MKYRIIILIIIIISLGQIILSYGKHITHARTHLRTHPPTAVQVVAVRWVGVRPTMTKSMPSFRVLRWRWMAGRCFIQINSRVYDAVFVIVLGVFSAYKTILGRTGTRTRDRMCFQSIRTVWDISRDDRARIATCSLLTSTDRLKENYCIMDVSSTQCTLWWDPDNPRLSCQWSFSHTTGLLSIPFTSRFISDQGRSKFMQTGNLILSLFRPVAWLLFLLRSHTHVILVASLPIVN